MALINYQQFLKTLPPYVLPQLANGLRLKTHQPHHWIMQFYDRDRQIHYEVQRVPKSKDLELGLHFESRNKQLNTHLLRGFSRRLIAVHAQLGDSIAADPWDRGWAKVYDIMTAEPLIADYQQRVANRLAILINCLHPLLLEIYAEPLPKAMGAKVTPRTKQTMPL